MIGRCRLGSCCPRLKIGSGLPHLTSFKHDEIYFNYLSEKQYFIDFDCHTIHAKLHKYPNRQNFAYNFLASSTSQCSLHRSPACTLSCPCSHSSWIFLIHDSDGSRIRSACTSHRWTAFESCCRTKHC